MGDVCRTGDELTQKHYGEALRWYRSAEQDDAVIEIVAQAEPS